MKKPTAIDFSSADSMVGVWMLGKADRPAYGEIAGFVMMHI
jgi:hypothetical protein